MSYFTTIKKILAGMALVVCVIFPMGVFAQAPTPINYVPLVDLPGTATSGAKGSPVELATYLPGIFRLSIGAAGVLAVIMIVLGGVQYLSTDAISGKSEGKERIQNALVGLLLAIGSFVILNTINPATVQFNLNLQRPAPTAPTAPTTPANPTTPNTGGSAWPDDSAVRADLSRRNISINRTSNCPRIGDSACTSVHGLRPAIISALGELRIACNCQVTITGGTEYWLHGNRDTNIQTNTSPHKPGGDVVDLSLGGGLLEFFRRGGAGIERATGTGCTTGTERYRYNGALYVNEVIPGNPPHFHVCFN
jgi:hypothetical protein